MYLRTGLFGLLSVVACTVYAQERHGSTSTAEVALSNDTLQLRYLSSGELVGVDGSQFSGTIFLSEERDTVLSAALLFPAQLNIDRFSIGFGPQIYAALLKDENDDVMSVTVGAEARYVLLPSIGLSVSGQAFYGPDILTFGSADNLTDLSARLELRVAPQLMAFGGMRWFEFDLSDGSGKRTLQEEAFVGIGYRF